jgi:hypothetical protein
VFWQQKLYIFVKLTENKWMQKHFAETDLPLPDSILKSSIGLRILGNHVIGALMRA